MPLRTQEEANKTFAELSLPVNTTQIKAIFNDTLILDIDLRNIFHKIDYVEIDKKQSEVIITEILKNHIVILKGLFANVKPANDVNWQEIADFLNFKYCN